MCRIKLGHLSSAVTLIGTICFAHGYSYTGERSIRTSVLSSFSYDKMARPSDFTTARVGYSLMSLNNLDINRRAFDSTGRFTLLWTDDRLRWNPNVYDDTKYIHALESEIWKPEILISNAQENMGLVSDDHLIYRIKYTGEIEWEPLISSVVDCSVDVTYFPFDNQTCSIELTSWGLPSSELSLAVLWDTVNLDEFRESGTWEVAMSNVTQSVMIERSDNGVIEDFSKIVFTIMMSRKPGNYANNTLLPMILSSFLMTFTKLIPLRSGERVVSGFLVLVVDTLLFGIFLQQIPDIATTAKLGEYLIGSLCIDFIGMFVTVCMAQLYHKQSSVCWVMRKFTFVMNILLCFCDFPDKSKVIDSDRESLLSIPTDDLKKIQKTFKHKKNAVYPEPSDRYIDPTDENAGFTETVTIKESALGELTDHYDVSLRTAKARYGVSQKVQIWGQPEGPDMGLARSRYGVSQKVQCDYGVDTSDEEVVMTWENVATVFDRLYFLVFLGVKVAFNYVLIGNLLGGWDVRYAGL